MIKIKNPASGNRAGDVDRTEQAALISRTIYKAESGPLVYILRSKVPFQFLLWLLRIEKPTRAKVSSHEQQTNGDSQKHVAHHLSAFDTIFSALFGFIQIILAASSIASRSR
jgi:hypothetical protein